jgi:hypothetical protein
VVATVAVDPLPRAGLSCDDKEPQLSSNTCKRTCRFRFESLRTVRNTLPDRISRPNGRRQIRILASNRRQEQIGRTKQASKLKTLVTILQRPDLMSVRSRRAPARTAKASDIRSDLCTRGPAKPLVRRTEPSCDRRFRHYALALASGLITSNRKYGAMAELLDDLELCLS